MENVFVKMDIEGESAVKKYEKMIPVKSLDWGIARTVDMTDLGTRQRGYGNAEFQKLTFTSELSKASTHIMMRTATGKTTDEVEIYMCRSGDDGSVGMETYLTITLENAFIDSYQVSGGEDSIPVESWTMGYRKCTIKYKEADFRTGKLSDAGEFVWNLETGDVS